MQSVVTSDARIEPPADMDEAPARAWREIVASLSAGHFRPSDIQLFRAFVEADHFRSLAYEELKRDGMFLISPKGTKYAHPAHSMMLQQAGMMASMAVKLRLCPSARIAKGEKAPKGVDGARPWSDRKSA